MIQYYDWLPQIESFDNVESIENEIAIFTYSDLVGKINENVYSTLKSPHKFDFFLIMLHTKGEIKMKIDMIEHYANTQSNVIKVAPGQIVSLEEYSDDFDATVIIMSKRFLESLLVYINGSIPLRIGTNMDCIVKVSSQERAMLEMLIRAIRHILSNKENPYRLQVVQHVIMAIFYSSEQIRNIDSNETPRSNADVLSKEFLGLVKDNFRRERQLQFYADKLCITPRYLSRVVKETTNSSAAEWIERYVVLEARALLKSTNMTIQQISDELNFPSQTFFGKYFKRRVGVSPKEYRRKG